MEQKKTDLGSEKTRLHALRYGYQTDEDKISCSSRSSSEIEAQESHLIPHASPGSITSWRGFLPCLIIFTLTGLLIFSNKVELSDGYICSQREGSVNPDSVSVLDGETVPTKRPSYLGLNHDTVRSHFAHHGPQPKAKIYSREPDPVAQQPTSTPAQEPTEVTSTIPTRTVLQNYEVAQPVLMPYGTSDSDGSTDDDGSLSRGDCKVLLMRRDFAWSYGDPFVANYTPPDCDFNRVVINFTVVSHGRQYDRLAIMYLGDTEVWRTSTAEPTTPPGIRWTYLKDMTQFLALWKQPQTLIFDLGNLISMSRFLFAPSPLIESSDRIWGMLY